MYTIDMTKDDLLNEKVKTPEQIRKYLDGLTNGMSAVCGGCFDLIHPGHIDLIFKAANTSFEDTSYISTVIIALNSDKSIKQLKGDTRPIINQNDRAFLLASLYYVDFITIFDEPVIDNVLKTIKPNYFVKSDQYTYETMTDSEKNIFKEYNITPLFLPFYNHYSTTHLINQVESSIKGSNCICADRLSKKEFK